jgi:DNA invertase Pin-like site-specific DNA recombinase
VVTPTIALPKATGHESLGTKPPLAQIPVLRPFERRLISQRTREALTLKRSQGVRLGRPSTMSQYAIDRITRDRKAGKSLAAIANGLNVDRIPTAQGGRRWHPTTIRYTLNRTS